MRDLLNKAKVNILEVVPSELSPDNQYCRSVAAMLALGVSASRKFTEIDYDGVAAFFSQDKFLKKEQIVSRAMEFFRLYIKELQAASQVDDLEFSTAQVKMIDAARQCPEKHKAKFAEQLNTLMGAAEPSAKQLLGRLNPWR